MSLDDVVAIGEQEGMKPGFTVNFPSNVVDESTGEQVYGSFGLSNSWPRKTGEGRDLYLDQFTGATLAEQTGWGYGSVSYTMDTLVSTHMGTQLGIFSRIFMTLLCVLAIWVGLQCRGHVLEAAPHGHPRAPPPARRCAAGPSDLDHDDRHRGSSSRSGVSPLRLYSPSTGT